MNASAAAVVAFALMSGLVPTSEAQDANPVQRAAVLDNGDKSYLVPAAEIVGFDLLLNQYGRHFSGTSDYDVTWSSIRRNLRGPWVTDNDPFKINQFAHPYQGSIYHGAARSAGLSYWEASAYTFAGSVWWEIAGEQTPPARNDQVASGIAGSFLGEPLYRMARLVLTRQSDVPFVWREWAAAAISPSYGFNRLLYGSRFEGAFSDHEPIYYGRLRLGNSRAVGPLGSSASSEVKRNEAQLDFSMDYGLPGKPGYTYDRPFDYFAFRTGLSSANGVEILSTRGSLYATDYALGNDYRGLWGLYGSYDYIAPQIFHVSATAVSLGTTGQWWATQDLALQGTAMAGIGYAAASTSHPSADDRNYHYGLAPRLAASFRLIAGARASFDIDAQSYFLGRITNRAAGRDDVARVDAAVTWRVQGRHAIGVKYTWSHRNTGNDAPAAGGLRTLTGVGIYYTLLGLDTFGTVDWREASTK